MYDRFTEKARKAISCAQQEARRLGAGADEVRAEHLLFGLIHGHTPELAALTGVPAGTWAGIAKRLSAGPPDAEESP